MKIAGQTIPRPTGRLVVFPRGDQQVAFKVVPVISRRDFDAVVPFPKMPQKRVAGQRLPVDNPEDPRWPDMIRDYSTKYLDWLTLSSLEGVDPKDPKGQGPAIEWDSISKTDPGSWHHWRNEMEEAGITTQEIQRLQTVVSEVNGLSDEYLDQARDSFLRGDQVEDDLSSSPSIEPSSMPSSELANGLA